jgi:hypothetical protein
MFFSVNIQEHPTHAALFKLFGWLKMLLCYKVGANNNLGHQNKVLSMETAKCQLIIYLFI